MAGGSNFPTVGLGVDLTDIDAGISKYDKLGQSIDSVGVKADAAAKKTEAANQKIKATTDQAATQAAAAAKTSTAQQAAAADGLTLKIDASTRQQLALRQRMWAQEAAAYKKVIAEMEAVEQAFATAAAADAKASAAARVAAEQASAEQIKRIVQDAAVFQALQYAKAGTAAIQAAADKVAAEEAAAVALKRIQQDVLNFQLRLWAQEEIAAQANAEVKAAAAARATAAIKGGSAGFSVSGDAQDMAATITATRALLGDQTMLADQTAKVGTAATQASAAMGNYTKATTAAATTTEELRIRQAAQLATAFKFSEGAEQAALAALKQGQSMKDAAAAGLAFDQALDAAKAKGAAFMASLDPLIRAQQVFNRNQQTAKELLDAGGLTMAEFTRAQQINTTALAAAGVGATGLASKMRELLVIIREFVRGDFSRMGGSATIAAQQFGLLTAQVISAALPWAALAAAIAFVIVKVAQYQEEQRKLQELTTGVGAAMGVTTEQIQNAGDAAAAAGDITSGAAKKIATAYVETGKIGADVFTELTSITKGYADATGEKLPQATSELAKAFADPAQGAQELNEKLEILNATQLEQIEAEAKAGDMHKAQADLLDALAGRIESTTVEVGGLLAVFIKLGKALSDINSGWANFLSGGAGNPLQTRIDGLQKLEDAAQHGEIGEPLFGPSFAAQAAKLQAALAAQSAAQVQAGADTVSNATMKLARGVTYGGSLPDLGSAGLSTSAATQIRDRLGFGLDAAKAGITGDSPDVIKAESDALDRLNGALATYKDRAQQDVDIHNAQIAAAKAITPVQKAEAAAAKQRAEDEGKYYTVAQENMRVQDAYTAALDKADKSHLKHNQTIDNGIEALLADSNAALTAADAYLTNAAAGDKAEASRKGIETATRKGMTAEQDYREILAQETDALSRQIEAYDKSIGALNDQHRSRQALNDLVGAGKMSTEQATVALEIENATRQQNQDLAVLSATILQHEAELKTASGKKALDLTQALATEERQRLALIKTINEQAKATVDGIDDATRAQIQAQTEATRAQAQQAALKTGLVGAGPLTSGIAEGRLSLIQKFTNQDPFFDQGGGNFAMTKDENDAFEAAKKLAIEQAELVQSQDVYNKSLSYTVTLMQDLADAGAETAKGLQSAFGAVGGAIGGIQVALLNYGVTQAKVAESVQEAQQKVDDAYAQGADGTTMWMKASSELYDTQVEGDKQLALSKQTLTDQTIEGVKSVFSASSGVYKALTGFEMAYRAVQLVGSARAIAAQVAETASAVVNGGIQAVHWAAAGAAKMFSQLGVYAFPAVAAMVAVLAGLGAMIGGGGSSVSATDPAAVQKATGAGTVLGDSSAQSNSLTNALALTEKYQSQDLGYMAQMTSYLKSIDNGIGAVAAFAAQSLGLGTGSTLNLSGMKLGTSGGGFGTADLIAGLIGVIFGKTSTTNTLIDQGLIFAPQTVGQIASQGVNGQTYQTIEQQKKTSLFGITLSSSSKDLNFNGQLDPQLTTQIQLLIANIEGEVTTAATQLGVKSAGAALDSFTVALGQLSFQGLSADDITKQLQAAFSKVGDEMASTAVPGLEEFQKVGEGALETLTRVATEYATVDSSLQAIGLTFGDVGLESLKARDALVQAMGGLDDFTSKVSAYQQEFLTDAEQIAPLQADVTKTMTALGYASVTTKDQFKALVDSLTNLSDPGQMALFTNLMNIAPEFGKVADFNATGAGGPGDIASQKRALDIQLMQATGDAEGALAAQRADALAQMPESLRAEQQMVWALQDQQTATENATAAAKALADAMTSELVDSYNTAVSNVATARQTLTAAYNAEAQALNSTISTMQGFADNFDQFLNSLNVSNDNLGGPSAQTAAAAAQFRQVFTQSMNSSDPAQQAALGKLTDVSQSYLDTAKASAKTQQDYARVEAEVKNAVVAAKGYALTQVDVANEQLKALNDQVAGLIDISNGVKDVQTAILDLAAAVAAQNKAGTIMDPQWGAIQNAAVNQKLASSLNYTGAFGQGGFDAWIRQQGPSTQSLARLILTNAGESNRIDFATGGAFLNGIVNSPTMFDMGRMGEAGPEAIMPLQRTASGHLGVRATGGSNDNSALLAKLEQFRAESASAAVQLFAKTASLEKQIVKRWGDKGVPVRGPNGPDDTLTVKVAS